MKYYADAHCDRPMLEKEGCFSWKDALQYEGFLQYFACWIEPGKYEDDFQVLLDMIHRWKSQREFASVMVTTKEELNARKKRPAGLLAVEGADALHGKLERLHTLWQEGVRAITLTWNTENELGSGALASGGLKPFGKEVIREMEQLGMIVDLAHCNRRTFWDAMEWVTRPPMISHTCAYELCQNPRNITKEQFLAVARCGGIVGIAFYPLFLTGTKTAGLEDVIRQFDFFLQMGYPKGLCFGSDFDGVAYLPEDLKSIGDLKHLEEKFLQENKIKKPISHIFYDNLLEFTVNLLKK